MDLGNIKIESTTHEEKGRWKSEDKKLWVTSFMIQMKRMGITYRTSINDKGDDGREFEIASPFDLDLTFTKPNFTPLMPDNYISEKIDFTELDISYHMHLNFSPLIMHLRQDVYTYILRCNDLNLNYSDGLAS